MMKIPRKNIKMVFLSICYLLLIYGCSYAKEDNPSENKDVKPQEQVSVDEYPVTQGSNPTRIISEKIFERFTGLDDQKGDYYKICHTGTYEAYMEYLENDTKIEMIIAQQPDPAIEKQLEGSLFKAIAKDALVFITNKANPIESLTLEQIKKILSGKITNWKEVGGKDEPINLFIRNESGGSQILLDKYVLNGGTMRMVPKDNVANDMRLMSKYVGENTKKGATFGYTTYYFAKFSGKRKDIKTIKIDSVKAEFDSIQNGTYPIISQIYIGVHNANSFAGKIYQWISTPEGQNLIKDTGYVPSHPS